GFRRRQREVQVERAVDRSESEADGAVWRAGPEVHGGGDLRAAGLAGRAETPAQRAAVWEREVGGVAERRIDASAESPLDAELPRVVLVGLNDARFDLDLRLRVIERRDEFVGDRQLVGQVADDERVGPRVDLDVAALRQRAFGEERLQLLGFRVTERLGQ